MTAPDPAFDPALGPALTRDHGMTFFYYDDILAVAPFYERVMGFTLVLDQGMARLYRIAPNSVFGIVDGHRGHLRHQPRSAALLSVVVQDVAGWHARLRRAGAAGLTDIRQSAFCEHCFCEDPAGYAIEIQRFHDPGVAALFR